MMKQPPKVWAVEQGSYSDYHVVGVFSSEENAQKIVDFLHNDYDQPSIVEWTLDPCIYALSKGYTPYVVLMLRNGDVESCKSAGLYSYAVNDIPNLYVWRRTEASAFAGKGISDCLHATVWARHAKHAIKIVNEHRTRMIANGEWK